MIFIRYTLLLLCGIQSALALELPSLFSDNMVLQRGQTVVIQGRSKPRESISVSLSNQTGRTTADQNGKWRIHLSPPPENVVMKLVVTGEKERIVIRNVVAGEVWLCSGQSNMEWPVMASTEADTTLKESGAHDLRLFRVAKKRSPLALEEPGGLWLQSSPQNSRFFSAVAYHLGLHLKENLKVPVGLIDATQGGTSISSWLPPSAATSEDIPRFEESEKKYEDQWKAWQARNGRNDPGDPLHYQGWQEITYDDKDWAEVSLPDFRPGSSVMLFRQTFHLPQAPSSSTLLSLGIIDDFDQVWVNGVSIGRTGASQWQFYSAYRQYRIPSGVLKEGKNVIAIRVYDHGGGGGFIGPADALKLALPEGSLSLSKKAWRRAVAQNIDAPQTADAAPGMSRAIPPGYLFNGMIAPLSFYPIAGTVWYQGESDSTRGPDYTKDLQNLITGWRRAWSRPDMPWLIVQLPNYGNTSPAPVEEKGWPALRAAQAEATRRSGSALLVPMIDLGDSKDIHPRNKAAVGQRLAKAALSWVYQKPEGALPPLPREAIWDGRGRIIIKFDAGKQKLQSQRSEALPGFALREVGGEWRSAEARISGPDEITASVPGMTNPGELRYAWVANPEIDLVTTEGQTLAPFALSKEPSFTSERR